MGKNKSTIPTEREIIWNYFQNVGSIAKVVQALALSRGKIINAITHYKKYKTFNNLQRKQPRKMTATEDRIMVGKSKADPFLMST